jgi:hypothetical protein
MMRATHNCERPADLRSLSQERDLHDEVACWACSESLSPDSLLSLHDTVVSGTGVHLVVTWGTTALRPTSHPGSMRICCQAG